MAVETTTVGRATIKIMSPEEIAAKAGGGEPPPLRLPEGATLFAERALRLRQLAAGHAMRDYLIFMADLAQAQHLALPGLKDLPLPSAAQIAGARAVGLPPLPAADWPRDPAWQGALQRIVDELLPRAPESARATLTQLRGAEADWLERQADCLLTGVMLGLDLAAAPIVAAALQCYWQALVAQTAARYEQPEQAAFARIEDATLCPCCGSRPTASITRQVGDVAGQRYLHCSLCAAEWHMVRIQCPHCLSGKSLGYQSLQAEAGHEPPSTGAAPQAVQAETCDDCGHYLKIVHTERDPFVEPAADDLASVTLDLLVSEAGLQRHGLNLMLLFGDPDGESPSPPDPGGGR
jgi:FdhE protein